ncbi:MAG: Uma2 family endonuclease [Gloeomargarita sp. SKYBB_i_bin120]|nr:Uma2 family endonuclease [Gloeomargarita sp. SKYG98]MCS7293382.1 Uma2 family endonuclease [Gloeomargarita sp. SKYB120]MDW8178947.1 Uma2 family endonuclease [Gloeomargarita sp. SKYBB_i_bin120]
MVTQAPVYLPKPWRLSEQQFIELVRANPEVRLELTAAGEVIAMPPTGGETGLYNANLIILIGNWNQQTGLGYVFDSSTGFRLPSGAIRSPDVAWVRRERWEALSPQEKAGFAPLCPDFVIELCSPTDELTVVQAKLREYLANGCRLGWLIHPVGQTVEIYRPERPVVIQPWSTPLTGEDVLPGLTLDLGKVLGKG